MFTCAQLYNFQKYFLVLLLAGLVLVIVSVLPLFDQRLHLVFCDVGQGDGILIYQRSTQVLIDGGPDTKVLQCLSNHMPFWDRKIEAVALTNPDRDHYAGLIEVLRRYEVATFAATPIGKDDAGFKVLQQELGIRKVRKVGVEAGETIKLGDVVLQSVWPTIDYLTEETDWPHFGPEREPASWGKDVLGAVTDNKPNKFSLVLQLRYGAFDALLTGDIEPPATDLMVMMGVEPVEVLKVPHHGSKNGLTGKLLEVTKPEVAVISNGKNNRYGHPHEEVIRLLGNRGIRIFRTDQTGEIEVITNGATWQIWE